MGCGDLPNQTLVLRGTHDLTIFDTTHFIDAKLGPTTPSHDNFCRLATSQRRKMMSSVSARHFSSSRWSAPADRCSRYQPAGAQVHPRVC